MSPKEPAIEIWLVSAIPARSVAFSNRPDNSTILGAAKITGRTASGWSVGVVEAVTAEERAPYINTDNEPGEAVAGGVAVVFVSTEEMDELDA